jgi:hypothetical protein
MDRELEKQKARRRRNDVKRVRDNTRRWMKAIWRESLLYMRLRGEDAEAWLELQVAQRERTATPCSCSMCGHRRENDSEFQGRTLQEQKFLEAWEQDGEVA